MVAAHLRGFPFAPSLIVTTVLGVVFVLQLLSLTAFTDVSALKINRYHYGDDDSDRESEYYSSDSSSSEASHSSNEVGEEWGPYDEGRISYVLRSIRDQISGAAASRIYVHANKKRKRIDDEELASLTSNVLKKARKNNKEDKDSFEESYSAKAMKQGLQTILKTNAEQKHTNVVDTNKGTGLWKGNMNKITISADHARKLLQVLGSVKRHEILKNPIDGYNRLLHRVAKETGLEVDCHLVQHHQNLAYMEINSNRFELCSALKCAKNENCRPQLVIDKIVDDGCKKHPDICTPRTKALLQLFTLMTLGELLYDEKTTTFVVTSTGTNEKKTEEKMHPRFLFPKKSDYEKVSDKMDAFLSKLDDKLGEMESDSKEEKQSEVFNVLFSALLGQLKITVKETGKPLNEKNSNNDNTPSVKSQKKSKGKKF